MARNEMFVMLEFFDSSDEEEEDVITQCLLRNPLLQPPIIIDDNNEHNEIRIFHEIFGLIERTQHVKIPKYIENIVNNYDDKDFIMHFRLSKGIAYDLINKFRVSQIFTSIQDHGENLKLQLKNTFYVK